MARDNFTKAVIEKLRTRVAHRCSNPECRVPTIGPDTTSDKATSIGVAAHITAASVGGPRYDVSLTEKARKSMSNGIWLCSNCSIAIDRDIGRYPVGLLIQWKNEAEQKAKEELGKKLAHKDDAIDTLTAAFTGQSKRIIPSAISNIHRASANALETLDPRFTVKSTYAEGMTHFGLFPKQDVPLKMNILKEYAQEYTEKYRQLVEHGVDLTISGDAVSIEGSKLFEEISSNLANGTIKLSPKKIQATQKIWLMHQETSVVENFDDIIGAISAGRQSFSFSGTACKNIFVFNYQKGLDREKTSATANLTINFDEWAGIDVRALPYFNKIYSLFEKIYDGWSLFTSLEVDGVVLLRSKEVVTSTSNFAKEILGTLDIINMARTLATALNCNIPFNPLYSFSAQEFSEFCSAVTTARGKSVYYKNDLANNITTSLIVDNGANNIALLKQLNEPIDFEMVQTNESRLQIFGQLIKLPNRRIRIQSATPHITPEAVTKDLSEGDTITVEWIPSDKFECKIEFEKST